MAVKVSEIQLYKFPLGRCAFALRIVITRAKAVGMHDVAELAGRVLAEVRRVMDMMMRMRASYDSQYPPETVAMDGVVDRHLGGLAAYFDVQLRIYANEPRGEAAEQLLRALLPDGVMAITHLPFAEEHAQVEALLERSQAKDLAEYVRALPELPALLERLRLRNDEYGELLRQTRDVPTREEVRQAQAECQENLAELMGLIVGLYALRAPDKKAERDHLLEPILEQNEALRAIRRRRRVPVDIHPETGEELPGTDDPGRDPNIESDQIATSPEDAPVA